jgi:hypothetical protein
MGAATPQNIALIGGTADPSAETAEPEASPFDFTQFHLRV